MTARPDALFDITVLIDALLNEQESDNPSSAILALAAERRVKGYVCAAAIEPLHDQLARDRGRAYARASLQRICAVLTIAPVDAAVIDAAIALGWPDLDDALTYQSARMIGLERVITLNAPDFADASLAVQAPAEFLQALPTRY
ncbi:MAG: PIN domain-containing protein [Thiocapsa sp.]|jgi:predicted nucleic acid-binding protein|nr:PIN domain-containing protein [Thiocapsa sp.]MCG6896646.1 PIN domain-containing protein [Thiocapsa sp.]MCG6983640.1 PIN domain-containing protein [Thiocapsa sp.]